MRLYTLRGMARLIGERLPCDSTSLWLATRRAAPRPPASPPLGFKRDEHDGFVEYVPTDTPKESP